MTDLTNDQLGNIFGFKLSQQQWSAVAADLAPSVMVAGAGSGKTTSMSARIVWLVGSGYVQPENVLGLTFTNKAAAQLLDSARASIRKLAQTYPELVSEDSSDPVISTYNSFAAGIVSEYGSLLGRDFTGEVLSEGARYQLAYRLICTTDLDMSGFSVAPTKVVSGLLALDSELSELAIDPLEVREHDQKLLDYLLSFTKGNDSTRRMIAATKARIGLSQLVEQWRQLKADRDFIEFSDQVRLAREIITRFPQVATELRSRFAVAMLDEYQDTSISQRLLLQGIFGSGFPLTAVGDPCQAIYGWRGASVANINDFTIHFPDSNSKPSTVYPLSANRRSGVKILEAANLISGNLRLEHPQVELLDPARDHPGELTLALFDTAESELEWIANQIAERHGSLEPGQDIAVLAPTSKYLVRVRDQLRSRGVPVQLHSAADLLSEPIVIDLRSLLTVVHEPTANPEFLRWASGVRWRIGARDLAALGRRAAAISRVAVGRRAENVDDALAEAVDGIDTVDINSLSDALMDLGNASEYSPEAYQRFTNMARILKELRSGAGLPLTEFIGLVLRYSGIDIQSQLNPDHDREQIAIGAFLDLASDFTDTDGRVSLGAFLGRLADIDRFDLTLDFEQPRDPEAVQLLTVHKAKGLEYTFVYVPNMTEGAFPGGKGNKNWTTDSSLVPWPIRKDAPSALADFPDYTYLNWPARVHTDEYLGHFAELKELESDRLAYVAFTRAKDSLIITSSWWGFTQKKPRGPHPYLRTLHDHFAGLDVHIPIWVTEAGDEKPETTTSDVEFTWPEPVPQSIVSALQSQAHFVNSEGTGADLDQVRIWRESLKRLREESDRMGAQERLVPLPSSVGASTLLRAMRDPVELAKDLARPMPRRSSPLATRGTEVHALIESHYSPKSLFDWDVLDEDPASEISGDIAELKRVFLESRFAKLTPLAVEQPFTLSVGGMPVTGYIDAVFNIDGRPLIVDWKTGSSANINPMQLALYRLAWARIQKIDWRNIDTCFFMLSTGEEVHPDTDKEIQELLTRD